jgi:hypothetical protein
MGHPRAHPSHRDKNVARMGHPKFFEIGEEQPQVLRLVRRDGQARDDSQLISCGGGGAFHIFQDVAEGEAGF